MPLTAHLYGIEPPSTGSRGVHPGAVRQVLWAEGRAQGVSVTPEAPAHLPGRAGTSGVPSRCLVQFHERERGTSFPQDRRAFGALLGSPLLNFICHLKRKLGLVSDDMPQHILSCASAGGAPFKPQAGAFYAVQIYVPKDLVSSLRSLFPQVPQPWEGEEWTVVQCLRVRAYR